MLSHDNLAVFCSAAHDCTALFDGSARDSARVDYDDVAGLAKIDNIETVIQK